ncbi:MAG: hypothetical protein M9899_01525 [Bdellovibrionaceae bacterium]|nr:hypothetical protein [Pseudobdellovibrionaceae bacterium]
MKYFILTLFTLVGFNAHAGKINCFADNGSWTEVGFDEDNEIEYAVMQIGLTDMQIIRKPAVDILEVTPQGHALKIDFFILLDETEEIVLIIDGDYYMDKSGIYKVTSCIYVD